MHVALGSGDRGSFQNQREGKDIHSTMVVYLLCCTPRAGSEDTGMGGQAWFVVEGRRQACKQKITTQAAVLPEYGGGVKGPQGRTLSAGI